MSAEKVDLLAALQASIDKARDGAHRWAADKGAEFALKGDRYLPRGRVRHRTTPNLYEESTLVALCGIAAYSGYWRGTGTQDEYERLSRIPRCSNCLRAER